MLIGIIILSFCISFCGAWFVVRFGSYFGYIDRPSHRSSHRINTPKGGGVGILAAFVFISIILSIKIEYWVPAFILSLVSLLDDRFDLSSRFRLIVQFVLAGIVVFNFKEFNWISSNLNDFLNEMIGVALSGTLLVFVVGTSNFFNFMDGINGIAAVTGSIAFCSLGYIALRNGTDDIAILMFGICFACLGFLYWNFPNAKVFMGDVSSILLGFLFSTGVVFLSNSLSDFICYAGFILPFYADEAATMYQRIRNKDPLSKPHRKHLYQVLVNEGNIKHWKVSLGYGILQIAICTLLILTRPISLLLPVLIIVFFFVFFVLVDFRVKKKLTNIFVKT